MVGPTPGPLRARGAPQDLAPGARSVGPTGAVLCVPDVYDESGVNHRKRIFDEVHAADYRGHRGVNETLQALRVS